MSIKQLYAQSKLYGYKDSHVQVVGSKKECLEWKKLNDSRTHADHHLPIYKITWEKNLEYSC